MLDYYSLIHVCNDTIEDIACALYWYSVEIGESCLVPYEVANEECPPTSGHAWQLLEHFRSDYGTYTDLMLIAYEFDYCYE